MTDYTRGNLWIPEVKTFFFGPHLKTSGIQTFVIHESDQTRENTWVPKVKTPFFGLHLTFRKLFWDRFWLSVPFFGQKNMKSPFRIFMGHKISYI